MTDKIIVLCTCSSESEASAIARSLVEKQLAACVNILPRLRSIYRWQGAIEEAEEVLLLVKSKRELFEAIKTEILAGHSYEVPEVIALAITEGSVPYLEWLDKETL